VRSFEGLKKANGMHRINALLAAALLVSIVPANALELSRPKSAIRLEQWAVNNKPFLIQRLYPAARFKSDCARAIQIAAQGDEAAMDKMIEQGRITFFAVGTKVYPVKSSGYRSVFIGPDLTTDISTWWLVREKGSTEKWWISVRAFSQD
jgi:hypothetical protein